MEHEQDSGASGVSRGQCQLHVLPESWPAGASAIAPLLGRLDGSLPTTQLLVVTSDADAAAAVAGHLTAIARDTRILAATEPRRVVRLLRSAQAQVVVGSPEVLVELVRTTTLKLDAVRAVVLAWVDDLPSAGTRALENLMAELPRDSLRVVITASVTPAVEQLVERYARRARRVQPAGPVEPLAPVSISYLSTSSAGRLDALRRLLDAEDPESAVVIARDGDARASVASLLWSLGYSGDAALVRVSDAVEAGTRLAVIYELPATDEALRRLVRDAPSARVIALVTPRQVATLRRMAGGSVSPYALNAAAERARSREERMRDELRDVLASGQYARELLALEPLLDNYDGTEIAAAALRLLEAERAKPRASVEAVPAMTRLFVSVGEIDNVRPGDLVGAFTNEAGIAKSDLGRVEVRDKHSTVEVATSVANAVVSKMNGIAIRGRRATVRVDEGRERRPGPPRERSGRPLRPRRDR